MMHPFEGARILVVDDEPLMRRLTARILTSCGYEPETAGSVAEARAQCADGEFALVLCDLGMPDETGDVLVTWLHDHHPSVAVLMVSGNDDPATAGHVIATGAYGYLLKPFKRNELEISVVGALERRRLELENREYRDRLEQRVRERTAELAWTQDQMITRLSLAIEFRSRETGEHVRRIGRNAALIGKKLGLDDDRCELIRLGAALHDVGKIGIPDQILLKPARLTDAERRQMEEHAEIGHRLLSGAGSELLELSAQIAWTHHERFDGAGYPRGLAGDEIGIEGRITAVADVFDALTHDRVYRTAFPVDDTIEMM
jgi:putative two-component system response regulator